MVLAARDVQRIHRPAVAGWRIRCAPASAFAAKAKSLESHRQLVATMTLEWKRGKFDELWTCLRKTWVSRCERYAVEEHAKRLGGMQAIYLSLVRGDVPQIISRHRTRKAAVTACDQHARHEGGNV